MQSHHQLHHHIVAIAEYEHWGTIHPVILSGTDRNRHVYVVGQTGTGKSTLLMSLIAHDIAAGHGVALLDPHGDLAHVQRPIRRWDGAAGRGNLQ